MPSEATGTEAGSARAGDGETLLLGGTANRGRVTRVGATVRRPRSASSGSVHALLHHLETVGFDGAPRHLGEDEAGREVLSYVEGDVPVHPPPAWAWTDGALVSVAELLHRYHEAVVGFEGESLPWHTRVPDRFRGGIVSHNDPNLDNVVFRDGRAVALIDFDLASPGSVEWDLANGARLWVPLQDPEDLPSGVAGRIEDRLRLFLDAYGLSGQRRLETVRAVPAIHEWGYDVVRDGVREGHAGYADYWQRAERRFLRTRGWLQGNLARLVEAVSDG